MARFLIPISALLLGIGLLQFAGGINSLILPLRGSQLEFSTFSLGLLGTGWAIGYVTSCFVSPRLVAAVGHIRVFGVLSVFAAIAVLLSLIFITPLAWIPLRAISGFAFAGCAMVVESWLNERTEASMRGRVYSIYTMVTLGAATAGQLSLGFGDTTGFLFFVLAAIFYCLALVPTALSTKATPKPLVVIRLDLGALWRNSPVAVLGVLLAGVSNSAFGTLSAVYAEHIGLAVAAIAVFTSLPVLAGAVAQIPVGYFSDRIDRRRVLVGIAAAAVIVDLAFILFTPHDRYINLAFVALFGASIYSMYPVIAAHANDHAAEGAYVQTAGGLLVLYGVGSVVGPVAAGLLMGWVGPPGLFLTTICAHGVLIGSVIWRMSVRDAVRQKEKSTFVPRPATVTSTPQTVALHAPEEVVEAEIAAAEAAMPEPDAKAGMPGDSDAN